jgi:ubiquinone/menaquinone biosynthesis C-methylase UbiE
MNLRAIIHDLIMRLQDRLGLWKLRVKTIAPAEGRVLEVGVGTGLNFRHYRGAKEIVALDTDPALIDRARARAREAGCPVRLTEGDACALPFPDAFFDAVVETLIFCTVPDALRGLREVARVVKPGGTIRLLEHTRSPRPSRARFQDRIDPVWTRFTGGCHLNRDTLSVIRAAGIEITRHKRYGMIEVIEGRAAP